MAGRAHAAIRLDMWSDDDWRSLSVAAQHLYLHLLSTPTLSYSGVADWREARIAGVSRDATGESIRAAGDELSEALFVVYDDETEEILIRSFLKHDGLLHKPNVAKAMVTAFGKTISPVIRGVIVYELNRLHDRHPEWKAFEVVEVRDLLSRPSVNPSGIPKRKGSTKGSEVDPSLLTPNSLLPSPINSHLATSPNFVRDDVRALCELLSELIVGNGSKAPTITDTWQTDARLLLDKDHRELESALRLMRWAQADTFWRGNVMSMGKFREKYDQLRLAANKALQDRAPRTTAAQRNLSTVEHFARQQQSEISA